MQIYFNDFKKEEEELINKVFNVAKNELNLSETLSVNLVMVDEITIKEMNNTYRAIDKITDVLSFPMLNDIANLSEEIDAIFGEVNIGDIYICRQKAKQQAEEYGHSYQREVCFLALHGLLHLLGYDHEVKEEEEQMFSLQKQILLKAQMERD